MTPSEEEPQPESIPPPSMSAGPLSTAFVRKPVEEPGLLERTWDRVGALVDQLGAIAILVGDTMRALFRRPLEIDSTIYQLESLGVRSVGIVAVTSVFIGMVMTIQFAYGLARFGGLEYIPRVIVLSFARELAPTLTAVIVGGRIGSGMAAEVGAMNVTEQVDAIRALGADPAKKLVVPRVIAAIIAMPVLGMLALVLGVMGAILVCDFQYDISPRFFLRSSIEATTIADVVSGMAKTPVFGFIIAIVGCHFGLSTTGGTEGVGLSTTRTVVVVSIAILIADFIMTKILILLIPI